MKTVFYILCLSVFYLYTVNSHNLETLRKKELKKIERGFLLKLRSERLGVEVLDNYPKFNTTKNYNAVFLFYNDTYCLMKNELFVVNEDERISRLTKIHNFHVTGDILFARGIEYNGYGIILVKSEIEIEVYKAEKRKIHFLHKILAPYAADALLYKNRGYVHLVTVNNNDCNIQLSPLYTWMGTYFHGVDSVHTRSPVKVTSFTDNLFEIIIILQNFQRAFLSPVYQFKFGKIKKIQNLATTEPEHVHVHKAKDATYVLISEKSGNNLLYIWDGSKLVKISNFQTETSINKTVSLTVNKTSILVIPQNNKLQLYRIISKEIQLIGEKTTNYTTILDIYKTGRYNDNIVTIVGIDKNKTTYFQDLTFKSNMSDPVSHDSKDTLRNCFNNLEFSVFKQTKKLKEARGIISQVKLDNNLKKHKRMAVSSSMEGDSDIANYLNKLRTKLNEVKGLLSNYTDTDDNNIIINNKTIIKGSIEADNLTGKNVDVNTINDRNWEPQNWLRYKRIQNITGPITSEKVTAVEINTKASDSLFGDLLTKNGDQDIWGQLTVANLTVDKIQTNQINGVQIQDLYLKSDPQQIRGLKTFENLKATKAHLPQLNVQPIENILSTPSRNIVFDDNLEVGNLIVDTIDNIHWDTFKNSVFRIGITKEISGDLTIPEFKANNITLKKLNGVIIEDLLTTSTDQVIDADIEFRRIYANNITPNSTNGIKLGNSAVQLENNTVVEGPVRFNKLYVKNLDLVGELDNEFFLKSGEHIIGTNESDFWQKYEGTVKIKGNLYLKNLKIQPQAKLLVSEEEFDPNLSSTYWTRNTTQTVPVHFEAQEGLSAPHLIVNKLNDVNFNQYMLNNDDDKFETTYHFKNISVKGDILLYSNANHTPNLTRLNEDAVKTTGSYYITGKKIYTDLLRAENLVTPTLNDIIVNETLNTKSDINPTGKKTFKKLIVKGNLTCNSLSLDFINNINISHLLQNAIYTDTPKNLEKLNFKSVTVENLFVTKLNNFDVHQHIQTVDQLLASNKIDNLIVDGKVVLKNVRGLSKINDIEFESLLANAWKTGRFGGFLINLEFEDHVSVQNLITRYVNDVDVRTLTTRFLYRNIPQDITALYTFETLQTENLVVSKINNISTENLIDVSSLSPQTIHTGKGLEFSSAIFKKSLNVQGTSPCNLVQMLKNFKNPPTKQWEKVIVKGNVTFLDPENILYRVFENAVTTNSTNVIKAPVRFSGHVKAENVFAQEHINGVNLLEVIEDAVLKDIDDEQIITGRKVFPTMTVLKAVVSKNTDIPVVNEFDIPEVNRALIMRNSAQNYTITGKKTFLGGLKCKKLYTKKISNIDVENIVSFDNPRKIPQAVFDSIEIENNLNISSVNHIDFDNFLRNRVLTEGEDQSLSGLYYFDNIQAEHIVTPSINKIKMDEVVFDIDQQNISSSKQFAHTVEVFGDVTCQYINKINISEMYEKSIAADDVFLQGSVTVVQPSFVNGNITTDYINGYPVQEIKRILDQGTIITETRNVYKIHKDIVDKIKPNMNHIQFLASDYMYIEKTQDLQIPIPNAVNAKAMDSKGYVLLHIDGEESGEYCNLPENCKCPVHYTIEVSPNHSVSIFLNKELQRIFTYTDDHLIAQFSTNSISTDSICRRDQTNAINEGSMMSWNTLPTSDSPGGFFTYNQFITGYISGVEFFTLHGQTYVIIGRYYDVISNTHDLDCYLLRFSNDKTTAEIIQKIPTKGAFSIYLFHTAQGITLIIGNIKTRDAHQTDEETQIYRFMENTQQFHLLRVVPTYGCSMAAGVVLGTDSLIVLAHRYAPLQVFKYYQDFDNYHLYQSFELGAPAVGISVFYTGGFGISDAYLCLVTENECYFIYSFRYIEGWKLESSGELDGLKNLIPLSLNKQLYLFAPSLNISSLLTVIKHGSV